MVLNKFFKKTYNLFILLLLIISLVACNNSSSLTTKEIASALIKEVSLDIDEEVSTNFSLPKVVSYEEYNTELTWVSANEDLLTIGEYDNDTYLAQISKRFKTSSVKITCYLNYDGEKREKEFNITISEATGEEIADLLLNLIDIDLNVSSNFSLPQSVSYLSYIGYLAWESNNTDIISIYNNQIARVEDVSDTTTVILTASLTYDTYIVTRDYYIEVESNALELSFEVSDNYAIDYNLDTYVYKENIYNTYLEVSLYIVAFNTLPSNYVLKDDFNKSDYTSENLLSCGGDTFQNREGYLPADDTYYECDINYSGGNRGMLRLVFSYVTLSVYYTTDHYNSFNYVYYYGSSIGSIYSAL